MWSGAEAVAQNVRLENRRHMDPMDGWGNRVGWLAFPDVVFVVNELSDKHSYFNLVAGLGN